MARQTLLAVFVFLALTEYSLCEQTEVFQDDMTSEHEISKRAVESAKTTFSRPAYVGLAGKTRGRPGSSEVRIANRFGWWPFHRFSYDTEQVETSKRAVQTARKTYQKLKSSFIALGKDGASGKPTGRPTGLGKPKRLGRPKRLRRRRRFGKPSRRGRRNGTSKKQGRPGSLGSEGSQDSSKLDIVFVMDKSGSIGSSNFNLEKKFVEKLIDFFPIFPAKTRVAIVTYSTLVQLEFDFNKYINRKCLRKGIQGIMYTDGSTATGTALQYVKDNLIFNSGAGARSGATKVIFVLTDGRSNHGITPGNPAGQLKLMQVSIFAMGVTTNIRQQELLAIASSPSHVFHVANYAALNGVTSLLEGDLSSTCSHGQIVYDKCGRRCTCQDGRLVNCCRLRKEFTDMSSDERSRYIETVKTAASVLPYNTTYEALLTEHRVFFDLGIHEVDSFLPWHRWFILQYENLLRQIDCRVTVPYWDWSLVGADPFSSDFWNTGAGGFGGNGVPSENCVNTGPFRKGQFTLIPAAGGRCLTRVFDGEAPDAIAVASLLTTHDIIDFETKLRTTFHNDIHCIIGGTMCSGDAASAPEFFLHHGFVDKIWSDWQKQSNAHKYHAHFQNQPSTMPSTPYRSTDLLDLSNQPGCVCVEYVDPNSGAYRAVRGLSKSQLATVPRLPLPKINQKAVRLFKTSRKEVTLITILRKKLEPKQSLRMSALSGKNRKLGFKLTDVTEAKVSKGKA